MRPSNLEALPQVWVYRQIMSKPVSTVITREILPRGSENRSRGLSLACIYAWMTGHFWNTIVQYDLDDAADCENYSRPPAETIRSLIHQDLSVNDHQMGSQHIKPSSPRVYVRTTCRKNPARKRKLYCSSRSNDCFFITHRGQRPSHAVGRREFGGLHVFRTMWVVFCDRFLIQKGTDPPLLCIGEGSRVITGVDTVVLNIPHRIIRN